MNIAGTTYADLFRAIWPAARRPPDPARNVEIPSIEPTADGWVGFNTNSRQQFRRLPAADRAPRPARRRGAGARSTGAGSGWTSGTRSCARGRRATPPRRSSSARALLRIPVAPVNDGRSVLDAPALRGARRVRARIPDGDFRQPRPPYRLDGAAPAAAAPGAATRRAHRAHRVRARATGARAPPTPARPLPLAGHPRARCHRLVGRTRPPRTLLAALGADVIHLESIQRPDGMRDGGRRVLATQRLVGVRAAFFLGANANKRGLTLDLADPRGLDLLKRLLGALRRVRRELLAARGRGLRSRLARRCTRSTRGWSWCACPPSGSSGPWRDHVGLRADDGADHRARVADRASRTTSRASSAARAIRWPACTRRSRRWWRSREREATRPRPPPRVRDGRGARSTPPPSR